jgi:hypothetical protein
VPAIDERWLRSQGFAQRRRRRASESHALAAALALWLANEARIAAGSRDRVRHVARTLASYSMGLLPGILFVAAVQQAMHGSPFRSGYASLDVLFRWTHVWSNVRRYPAWLIATHTPAVLLAALAPFAR